MPRHSGAIMVPLLAQRLHLPYQSDRILDVDLAGDACSVFYLEPPNGRDLFLNQQGLRHWERDPSPIPTPLT